MAESNTNRDMNRIIRGARGNRQERLNLGLNPGVAQALRDVAKDAGLVTNSRGQRRGNVAALLEILAAELTAGRIRVSPVQVTQD